MKLSSLTLPALLLTVVLLAVGCGGGAPSVNLSDRSLGVLSWGTFQFGFVDKDLDKALVYANEAEKLYGAEAREMQASLSGFSAHGSAGGCLQVQGAQRTRGDHDREGRHSSGAG